MFVENIPKIRLRVTRTYIIAIPNPISHNFICSWGRGSSLFLKHKSNFLFPLRKELISAFHIELSYEKRSLKWKEKTISKDCAREILFPVTKWEFWEENIEMYTRVFFIVRYDWHRIVAGTPNGLRGNIGIESLHWLICPNLFKTKSFFLVFSV